MAAALHIIDPETSPDALREVAALCDPDDHVISVGPVRLPKDFPWSVRCVHRPLGSATAAGLTARGAPSSVGLIHAWSVPSAQAGEVMAQRQACPMIIHLPHFPPPTRLDHLARLAASSRVAVTVPTDACRRRLLAEGLLPPTVHVLPVPSSTIEHRQVQRAQTRQKLAVSREHRLMVAPGALTRQAGHKYACWVFAVLREVRDDLRLLVVDDGPARTSLEYFTSTLGCGREVVMAAGSIPLPQALAAADLAVSLPCGDSPVVSLVAALATGLPVVAWATADVQELTADGRVAALSTVGDVRGASAGALRLLEDAGAAAKLASAAAGWAKDRFSAAAARTAVEKIGATLRGAAPA